ncbi:UDP-N-acetylmuramoyl-L-alanyl-D-glutamate--2,6-diaminopimelate ligase [Halobacillus fulvus]|nr:UDP-N-acetylmuramoyl-L-alanyl-D-glutamate--2,6-diaminopimelate ligase [Halobacillus fulvus]
MNMKFNEWQQSHIYGPEEQEVESLVFHSKRVQPNAAFFSIKGEQHDGHVFIEEAIQAGASTIIGTDREFLQKISQQFPSKTFIHVTDIRDYMATFSKAFYQAVDEKMTTVGVTGTNGKTTVTAYVRSLLTLLGLPTGSIGTTGIWSSKEKLTYKKSTPTTPESTDLHQIFHHLYELGDRGASMEVSSIALDQKRVQGIWYDVAIHTNFSEEHLEYHQTMEHYKKSKMKLFAQSKAQVINADDSGMAEDLLCQHRDTCLTYSIDGDRGADIRADYIDISEEGSTFDLYYSDYYARVYVPVYGTYNVANVLAAIGTALHLGFTIQEIIHVLPKLEGPEGRFQVLETPYHKKIIIDYAHTPVALNRLVEEVKKLEYDRLICMIAGIGIRDFNKMPKMAEAIDGKADQVVVTVDHPGYHDPQDVVDKVMTGFRNPYDSSIHQTLTREEGVKKALELGRENDIVLLTSGCINNAQIIKGEEVPHSDEEIIRAYHPTVV